LVWFSLAIPKHSFILWLAIKYSLSTGDRILNWGAKGEVMFCRGCIECRDHLFFGCGYRKRIWQAIMKKHNRDNIPIEWEDILSKGVKEWRGKSLKAIICRFGLGLSDIPCIEAEK